MKVRAAAEKQPFNEIHKNLTVNDLKQVVEEIYSLYTFCMFLFENLIGSFSLIRDDAKFNLQYLKYFKDNECCNNFSREEHQYYSDCEKGISLLVIDNGIYHVQDLLKTHEFKFVDGIDGRILYQKNNVKESFNYISNEDWRRISQVITDMEIKDLHYCLSDKSIIYDRTKWYLDFRRRL